MSRIGKKPIEIPSGVDVQVGSDHVVRVKGLHGALEQRVDPDITVRIEDGHMYVERPTDQRRHRSLHGLYRSLLNNMVVGVSRGWELKQELIGVGFKCDVEGDIVKLALGYSHDIHVQLPPEVKGEVSQERRGNPILTLRSADRQLLGMVASKIRSLRPPEPYRGKGIRFVGEEIRRKAGKSATS